MSKDPLFTHDEASAPGYIHTRAAGNEHSKKHRENCEELWELYEPHADPEFRTELRSNFDSRYWEMYLTTTLIKLGYDVCCPKPGPDVGIEVDSLRIWFEATSPDRGQDGSPDQVPVAKPVGQVFDVPNEQIVLRYLNSISAKNEQYRRWLKNGCVQGNDAFIIAFNPRRLGHDIADTIPPRILQAAFNLGHETLTIDRKTMETVGSGFQVRRVIEKASGSKVATGVFEQELYAVLSGLLCSRIDVANQPRVMGEDFQLVPNPNATVFLPEDFRLPGTFFSVARSDRCSSPHQTWFPNRSRQ